LALASERIGADLRSTAYEHLLKLSLEYFGGRRTGDLMTRIGSETDRLCVFLSLHLLDFATDVVPRQFTTISINPNFIALWDLWPQISEQRAAGKPTDVLEAAAWHKISGPLSAVLMPLLGAVAAFGLARSGKLFVRAVIGMALGFAFFVADNFMLAMGNFGTVPPLMAAWAPFLLFLLIGEAVLIRTEE
jgi:lipopolysaccharide export system permease protein